MAIKDALPFFKQVHLSEAETVIAQPIVKEVVDRLTFLVNVGLGYLTLSRSAAEASEFTLGFTPILAPMSRGILATVSARMTDKAKTLSDEEIRAVWSKAYEGQDFMVLLPEGTLPATGNIIGSNAAHLQVVTDRKAGRIYAFAAIDNLNRGTAGQAVQSLNIALGLPEDAGLTKIGVAP